MIRRFTILCVCETETTNTGLYDFCFKCINKFHKFDFKCISHLKLKDYFDEGEVYVRLIFSYDYNILQFYYVYKALIIIYLINFNIFIV